MTVRRFKTYSEPTQVTDKEAVQNLINKYRFPGDVEIFIAPGTNKIQINGGDNFIEAYTTDADTPQEVGLEIPQTPALAEFLSELAPYIVPGDALILQLLGIGQTDSAFIALEWKITTDEVQETAFTVGDSSDWTELNSNQ